MGLGPALPIVVGGGISEASPFAANFVPIVASASPPSITDSILQQVVDGSGDTGFRFTKAANFGFIGDGGAVGYGIEIRSEVGGGGVYLTDYSATGVYLLDSSNNGSGIYILTEDKAPAHYNAGIYISQDARDSAGIYIEERSTSGNAEIVIDTVNGDITIHARGAGKNLHLTADSGTIIFTSSTGMQVGGGLVALAPAAGPTVQVAGVGGAGVAALALTNLTDGAGVSGATLLNSPVAGNPTIWIPVDVNGATKYLPLW